MILLNAPVNDLHVGTPTLLLSNYMIYCCPVARHVTPQVGIDSTIANSRVNTNPRIRPLFKISFPLLPPFFWVECSSPQLHPLSNTAWTYNTSWRPPFSQPSRHWHQMRLPFLFPSHHDRHTFKSHSETNGVAPLEDHREDGHTLFYALS